MLHHSVSLKLFGSLGLAICGLALVFGSCRSTQGHSGLQSAEFSTIEVKGFDVNDVSFLFPKVKGINEASPKITADDLTSDGSKFIPDSVFSNIMAFSEKIRPGNLRDNILNRASWRVQSFRFDPCAPSNSTFQSLTFAEMAIGQAKPDCQVEIRTIMQPMEPLGIFAGSGHVADVSMHLTFHLGSGSDSVDLVRLVEELKSLKTQSEAIPLGRTSGTALGRHPGLYAELNSGAAVLPFAEAVKGFLQRNLGASKLVRVTFSEVDSRSSNGWFFFGGDVKMVDGIAVWSPFNLPHDPAAQSIEYRPDNASMSTAILPVPATTSTNSLFTPASVGRGVAINPGYGVGSSGRTMPISQAQEIIGSLENPVKTNIFNTDCVSCHTSTSRGITLGIPSTGFAERPRGITGYAFAPAFSFTDVRQRTNTDGLQVSLWNVRNFGWFDWQATVSNRTVNEAMASALYINGLFFKGNNPGLDCIDADKDGVVSSCLLQGKGSSCMDLCSTASSMRSK